VKLALKWAALAAASLAAGGLAQWSGIPAPWLVSSMVVAIALAVAGIGLSLPRAVLIVPQGIIGITVGQVFTLPILTEIAQLWLPLIAVTAATIVAAGTAGWILARYSPLSAQTAAWGSAPGASVTMIALSVDHGADPRIVAFMQYLRVTLVVVSAALVTRLLHVANPSAAATAFSGTSPFALLPFAGTLLLAIGSAFAGRYGRVPGAQFLFPLVLGAAIHVTGVLPIDVTWWLLAGAYIATGWTIGLLYTRKLLAFVLRLLPVLILSTGVLLVMCALSGALLVGLVHVDPLTAYLATTPGGLDSVAIIALGSGSNAALVLAIQMLRLLAVVACGPPLAKTIARFA
jgi:membrane AbrB-like protein